MNLLLSVLLAAAPGPRKAPDVVWSFDDAPNTAIDKILPLLRRYRVRAVFFILGSRLTKAKNRARLRRIAKAGHIIGNHLWSHASPCPKKKVPQKRWLRLTKRQVLSELRRTQRAIRRVVGRPTSMLYRAPFGDWCHLEPIKRAGYQEVGWHVADLYTSRARMWKVVSDRLRRKRKVIVLFHYDVEKLKWLLRKVYSGAKAKD